MKILIVGATGVLGRALVPMLVSRHYEVVAVGRNADRIRLLGSLGAHGLLGDILNPQSLRAAAKGCDVVLHLATSIPENPQGPADWRANDWIRTVGTANLLHTADQVECGHYIQQSIVFPYGDHGDEWIDESVPFAPELPAHLESAVAMEQLVRGQNVPWTILRGGLFYGKGTRMTDRLISAARAHQLQLDGDGSEFVSLIHPVDMAQAIVQTVERGSGDTRVFNVVDDVPVRRKDLYDYIAKSLGCRLSVKVRKQNLAPSQRCSNLLAKQELKLQPNFPTYREGLAELF
jgi:nucleoside-diphosphate-sugar epimerase